MANTPVARDQAPVKREIKQERAARTREEILEAAITLFARRGFLATTMSELARSIKMTPGALYWHFPTKEDVLLAAIEELNARFLRDFGDLVTGERPLPAREQLIEFLRRMHSVLRGRREYGIFFGMVAAESAEQNERVAEALRQSLDISVDGVTRIIRHGQTKTKEFRSDLDAKTLAHNLIASLVGIIIHQRLYEGQLEYDPMVNAVDSVLMEGILSPR